MVPRPPAMWTIVVPLALVALAACGDADAERTPEAVAADEQDSFALDDGDGAASLHAVQVSKLSYLGWGPFTHACTKPQPLRVYAPVGASQAPVLLWLPGTGALIDAEAEADAVGRAAAARGWIVAVVQYASLSGLQCAAMDEKAACAFSDDAPSSAVATICALPGADCDRGVAVGGLSQGAAMAILARNHSTRARAAWLMGFGGGQVGSAWRGCYVDSETAFSGHEIRVVNGRSDNQSTSNLNTALGTSCKPGQTSCLRLDGSGLYVVPDAAVEDGVADHCYFNAPDAAGNNGGCSNFPSGMDAGWAPPAMSPWSLLGNLAWLQSRID